MLENKKRNQAEGPVETKLGYLIVECGKLEVVGGRMEEE